MDTGESSHVDGGDDARIWHQYSRSYAVQGLSFPGNAEHWPRIKRGERHSSMCVLPNE